MNVSRQVFIIIICSLFFSCKNDNTKTTIESRFYTDSIYSSSLNEYRKHTMYLPRGFDKNKTYPIIYATDGNSNITDKKKLLDSLIASNNVVPFIFVASFSNNKIADSTSTTTGDGKKVLLSYRNFEYVDRQPNRPEDSLLINRFENHKSYFSEELINHVEKQLRQPSNKDNRIFYGVSNGAGFGLSLLNSHPELIGTYLCFSTFGGDIQTNKWDENIKYPNLYLRYGTEEPFFLKEDAEFLNTTYATSNAFIEIEAFNGGHNDKFWSAEFIKIIGKVLNK